MADHFTITKPSARVLSVTYRAAPNSELSINTTVIALDSPCHASSAKLMSVSHSRELAVYNTRKMYTKAPFTV